MCSLGQKSVKISTFSRLGLRSDMGHATGKGKEGRDRRIDNLPSLLPQESGTFLPTLRSWQDVSVLRYCISGESAGSAGRQMRQVAVAIDRYISSGDVAIRNKGSHLCRIPGSNSAFYVLFDLQASPASGSRRHASLSEPAVPPLPPILPNEQEDPQSLRSSSLSLTALRYCCCCHCSRLEW